MAALYLPAVLEGALAVCRESLRVFGFFAAALAACPFFFGHGAVSSVSIRCVRMPFDCVTLKMPPLKTADSGQTAPGLGIDGERGPDRPWCR